MKTILCTFETDKERDTFIKFCKDSSKLLNSDQNEARQILGTIISKTLDSIQFDPPIRTKTERIAALYVTGQKMVEGPLSDMEKRFQQEVAQHSGNVEIRELRGGEWITIQSRRTQK